MRAEAQRELRRQCSARRRTRRSLPGPQVRRAGLHAAHLGGRAELLRLLGAPSRSLAQRPRPYGGLSRKGAGRPSLHRQRPRPLPLQPGPRSWIGLPRSAHSQQRGERSRARRALRRSRGPRGSLPAGRPAERREPSPEDAQQQPPRRTQSRQRREQPRSRRARARWRRQRTPALQLPAYPRREPARAGRPPSRAHRQRRRPSDGHRSLRAQRTREQRSVPPERPEQRRPGHALPPSLAKRSISLGWRRPAPPKPSRKRAQQPRKHGLPCGTRREP
jgi:hypothetical protein